MQAGEVGVCGWGGLVCWGVEKRKTEDCQAITANPDELTSRYFGR